MNIENPEKFDQLLNRSFKFSLTLILGLGLLHFFFHDYRLGGVWWFNMDQERNLPTWISGIFFFLMGITALGIFHEETAHNKKESLSFQFPQLWIIVAAIGMYLALDEMTILHENLFWREVREGTEQAGGFWTYLTQWQILFAPAMFCILIFFLVFFTNRLTVKPRSFLIALAGIGTWVIALSIESIRQLFKASGEDAYLLSVLFEETFEMLGALLLLTALVIYLRTIVNGLSKEEIGRLSRSGTWLDKRTIKVLAGGGAVLTIVAAISLSVAQSRSEQAEAKSKNTIDSSEYVISSKPLLSIPQSLNRNQVEHFAKLGGEWIINRQWQVPPNNGRFLYQFDPRSGEEDTKFKNDNFLRQAGTDYSLLLLYEATGRKEFLLAAENGVTYLMTSYQEDPENQNRAWFNFEGKVKLGGSALPLLSLLKLKKIRKTNKYDRQIKKIAQFMLDLQGPDGKFLSIYMYDGSREHRKTTWDSKIYPGEAILALTRLYEITKDTRYLNALDNAYRYYHDLKKYNRSAKFMPWTTTAMCELFTLTRDTRFRDFAFELSDFMIAKHQQLNPAEEFWGSFHKSPSANTATYLEGLLDAYTLAKKSGDKIRTKEYYSSIVAGFTFLDQLQYRKDEIIVFSNMEDKLVGAIRTSPENPTVRIDFTQHSVSAAAKVLMNFPLDS